MDCKICAGISITLFLSL